MMNRLSRTIGVLGLLIAFAAPSSAFAPPTIPEPGSFLLVAGGLGAAIWLLRKQKRGK